MSENEKKELLGKELDDKELEEVFGGISYAKLSNCKGNDMVIAQSVSELQKKLRR